jgi:cbb3-type cytochrome oxidase subunit 1
MQYNINIIITTSFEVSLFYSVCRKDKEDFIFILFWFFVAFISSIEITSDHMQVITKFLTGRSRRRYTIKI